VEVENCDGDGTWLPEEVPEVSCEEDCDCEQLGVTEGVVVCDADRVSEDEDPKLGD
jgi:hypothetical protein